MCRLQSVKVPQYRANTKLRTGAVVGKRTTAVMYAEGGRIPLFKCVPQWQK